MTRPRPAFNTYFEHGARPLLAAALLFASGALTTGALCALIRQVTRPAPAVVVVDRIEDAGQDWHHNYVAVLEAPDGTTFDIPLTLLPTGTAEGSRLVATFRLTR